MDNSTTTNKYRVTLGFTVALYFEVEANGEDEAFELAEDQFDDVFDCFTVEVDLDDAPLKKLTYAGFELDNAELVEQVQEVIANG